MKTLANPSRTLSYLRRAAGWVTLGVVPALAATLPNCSVITHFYVAGIQYSTSAVFRNGAGMPFTVTDTDAMFASEMTHLPTFGAEELAADGRCPHMGYCGDGYVREQWLRYISRRFAEGSDPAHPSHDAFQTRYGAGPYCLVAGTVTVTRGTARVPDLVPVAEAERALPTECDSTVETGCGNAAGVVPRLGLMPASGIDFGTHPVGLNAGRQAVVISNAGPGRLCLAAPRLAPSSVNMGDFLPIDASDCGLRTFEENMLGQTILVPPTRPSCTVWVDFRPGDAGPRSADLVVASNDPTTPSASLPLAGVGEAGVLVASPNPVCLNVPPEIIGGMSCRRRTVDLGNPGPGVVTVRSASIAADAPNWTLQLPAGVTTPFVIPVGGTVTLTVLECGTAPMDSTFLTLASNSTTPTLNVPLVGPTSGCTP